VRTVAAYISTAEMPSEFITDFLVTLVQDNNYFSQGLLWPCEVQQLRFSRYTSRT
jgi:hypothetical protein